VVSASDTVSRPWYTPGASLKVPTMDDPRLGQYSDDQKRQILTQLRNEKMDPNLMIQEPCAITCRVSKSFCRIGHVDLFARRAEKKSMENSRKTNSRYDTSTNEWKELEAMIWHACYREFRSEAYDPFIGSKDIAGAATALLEQSADRLSTMVTEWVRVGFAQGNFNADNCLIGGHTMDYGPFGFMEEYFPLFAKWTGSGQHFGFLNQPSAGLANYQVLVESVVPVICAATKDEDGEADVMNKFLNKAKVIFEEKTDRIFRRKLGFDTDVEVADILMETLDPLMRQTRVDWTLFWRQLTYVARDFDDYESTDYEAMLNTLVSYGDTSPFYDMLTPESRDQYLAWIQKWREMLAGEGDVAERMRMANPKYVLREWMMVDAYKKAEEGDTELLHDLYELIKAPYEEGTSIQQDEYYRRASESDLTKAGTAFFS
jgi:serine/tyrosine/threonine adenylyltransferase